MSDVGLRERKKARTRASIAACAVRMFAERGYDAVTLEEIAAEAEVGLRTVFRYFGDKQELLFAESDITRDALVAAVRARPTGEPAAVALGVALASLISGWQDRKPEGRERQDLIDASPALRAREHLKHDDYSEALAGPLAERGVTPATGRLLARAGIACLHQTTQRWLHDPRATPRRFATDFRRDYAALAAAMGEVVDARPTITTT